MPRTPSSEPIRAVARDLRRNPTPAEAALWDLLRDRRIPGLKFRRQVAIGRFVADFLCVRLRLVLELDGGIHATEAQAERDEVRDVHLRAMGYTVLRFENREVLAHPEAVLRRIEAAVRR